MIISSLNVVAYGGLVNSGGNPYNPTTGSGSYTNKSHGYTTGYKMQLVFLQVDGLTAQTPPDEKWAKIDAAWAKATPDTVRKIGAPIYLSYGDSAKDTSLGFRHTDFEYGLGSVVGSYNRAKSGTAEADLTSANVLTPSAINAKLSGLNIASMGNSTKVKYSNSTMQMNDADFPILLGSKPHGKDLKSYFMTERTQAEIESDPDVNSPYYATSSFAAVVNYIATEAGTNKEDFIYFGRIKNKNGSVEKYDDLIPNNANCFELGLYNGGYGEYRLVVSDYWVCSSGVMPYTAFTLRDAAWMWTNSKYKGVVSDQTVYVKGLGVALRLEDDDIWGLRESEASDYSGSGLNVMMSNISEQYYGGGLSFFSSSMMSGTFGKPNYIGSVVNVFLPGSLSSSDKDIKTAEVEYVGPKSSDTTTMAISNAAQQIAMAISGAKVNGGNIFTDSELNQTNVLLNGTIQLPGISSSSGGFQGTLGYAEKYEAVLRAILDGAEGDDKKIDIDSGTRDAIKQILQDELGLDVDGTQSSGANAVNLQDIALAVYVLSKYQLDGVEADGSGWGDVYDNPSNKWKQIITYYDMLLNKKPQATIDASADEGTAWSGPLSITAGDLTGYNTSAKFGTVSLADTSNLESYAKTSEGAQQAIEAGALDSETTGQITTDPTKWDAVFKASELKDGLVRVPVALGTTQVYLGSIDEEKETVNIGKNQLPQAVGSAFAAALNGIRSTSKPDAPIENLNLSTAANKIWPDAKVADKSGTYPRNSSDVQMLAPDWRLDSLSLYQSTDAGKQRLFAPLVKGDTFNATYNTSGTKQSLMYNTFGMNALANVVIAATLGGYKTGTETNNIQSLNTETEGTLVAIPSYAYYTAAYVSEETGDESAEGVSWQDIAHNFENMTKTFDNTAYTVNDGIFASLSNNDPNLILAASNVMLNRSLASTKSQIKTDVVNNTPITNIKGDYGMSYVVWDAGLPIDIQFVTEVGGRIVPLESANPNYEGGLISNVWYGAVGQDKALELSKYYTVKKGDKEATLEVEEAVVKSATVNDKTSLQNFYDAYAKAYNSDSASFTYNGSDGSSFTTTRTKLTNTSPENSNIDAYTMTHASISPAMRYIVASSEGLGLPTGSANLTTSVYNTVDVVPTEADKNAFVKNNEQSRLQVIIKVKGSGSSIVQYNFIEGLEGNRIEVVDPNIVEDKGQQYVSIEGTKPTSLGYSTLVNDVALDQGTRTSSDTFCAFASTIDKNPLEVTGYKIPDKTQEGKYIDWDRSKYSLPEFALSRTQGGIKNFLVNYRLNYDTAVKAGYENGKGYSLLADTEQGVTADISTSDRADSYVASYDGSSASVNLPIDQDVKAIYVHYRERPPVYEVYRDANGNEQVYKRVQQWASLPRNMGNNTVNSKNHLIVSTGAKLGDGVYDNALGLQYEFYPVMAVAADLKYNVTSSTDVIDVVDNEDGTYTKTIVTPPNWEWVKTNLIDYGNSTKGAGKNAKSFEAVINGTRVTAADVQTVGVDGLYDCYFKQYVNSRNSGTAPVATPFMLESVRNNTFGSSIIDGGYYLFNGLSPWQTFYWNKNTTEHYNQARNSAPYVDFGYSTREAFTSYMGDRYGFIEDGSLWTSLIASQLNEMTGKKIDITNTRVSTSKTYNHPYEAPMTTPIDPSYQASGYLPSGHTENNQWVADANPVGIYDSVNESSLVYPKDYEQPEYAIYVLYIQGETSPVTPKNSFYAVLPQDMITRAVAYRDLARQYYQREEVMRNSSKNYEKKDRVGITQADFQNEVKTIWSNMAWFSWYQNEGKLEVAQNISNVCKVNIQKSSSRDEKKLYFDVKDNELIWIIPDDGYTYALIIPITRSDFPCISDFIKAGDVDSEGNNRNAEALVSQFGTHGKTYSGASSSTTREEIGRDCPLYSGYITANLLRPVYNVQVITESTQLSDDSGKPWKTDFTTWYTLYINQGDSTVRRVNFNGVAKLGEENNNKDMFEKPGTKNFDNTYASIDFGPDKEQLMLNKTGGAVQGSFLPKNTKENLCYVIPSAESPDPPLTKVKKNFETKDGALAQYGDIQFGIETGSTPATVGNVEGGSFFASKVYDASERIPASNTDRARFIKGDKNAWSLRPGNTEPEKLSDTALTERGYYWTDYYHYYNDYNFYVMIWRGIDKPTLSAAATITEQEGISSVQNEALSDLTANPIGRQNNITNGFTSTPHGAFEPTNNKAVEPNYWAEEMYPANVKMGTQTWVNTTSLPMINGYYWIRPKKDIPGGAIEISYFDYRTNSKGESLQETVGGNEDVSRSELSDNAITEFNGNLLVDTLIDSAGVGAKDDVSIDSSRSGFTVNGGSRYGGADLTFSKSVTKGVGNEWTTSTGDPAKLWVNFYPWVRMHYQTVDPDKYYTPKQGEAPPVETKETYVLSRNQSTLTLLSSVDIGFSRGTDPATGKEYGEGASNPETVPNHLTIGSTQWSTHANTLSNPNHIDGFGKGSVLPGGAIYTLTTGTIGNGNYEDALARSKVAVRYWKPYVPDSMMSSLVETNRVDASGHGRYTKSSDAARERTLALQRYKVGVAGVNDTSFNSIVEAVMQTLNNTKVALRVNDLYEGNIFDKTTDKYRLKDAEVQTDWIDLFGGSPVYNIVGLSGERSAGNSASLDTVAYTKVIPTYYRVWSDPDGNVVFGWLQSNRPPTIQQLEGYRGNISTIHGCVDILNSHTDTPSNYEFNDTSLGGGVPYGVDQRTKLITNYVNSIDRNIGYSVTASGMPAANGADSNHLLFDMGSKGSATTGIFTNNDTYGDKSVYPTDIRGNGIATVENADTLTTYAALVNKLSNLKETTLKKNDVRHWDALLQCVGGTGAGSTNMAAGKGVGYKWLHYNMGRGLNKDYSYDMDKWYNEASDGFGVVVYTGIIEVGFGGPVPNGDSTLTPVRTSIVDPQWQPPHTSRSDLFTTGHTAYFYTAPVPDTNFVAKMYGSNTNPHTERFDSPEGSRRFIGLETSAGKVEWIDLDEQGLSWLYRSRTIYIGNGSVMDLN